MVPPCSDRISRVPPYSRIKQHRRIRGCHPLWPDFPDRSAYLRLTTGLLRFRSPLLAESLLMSVPPGTEMFQFPGFASPAYVFSGRYPIGVGCPIRISTDQRLLAAPHGFSQRATSFIASWCQGIHRMPFSCSRSFPSHRQTQPTLEQNEPPPVRAAPSHHAQEPSKLRIIPSRQAALLSTTHGSPTAITSARQSNACERQRRPSLAASFRPLARAAAAYRSDNRDRRHVHRRTRT